MNVLSKDKESSDKVSNLNTALRKMKIEYKQLKEQHRQDDALTKNNHEQIMRIEERCKK
jgi:hypothetical protein